MPEFNVAETYCELRERYIQFLLDKMVGFIPEADNKENWQAVRNQLKETWLSDEPEKGIFPQPLLESLFTYRLCDFAPAELIAAEDAVEPTETKPAHYLMREIMGDFRLYTHQLQALRAYNQKKSMIISSGTGSGKTECFIYPMINRILWERSARRGQLPRGVKVLLVYPMNALINDQRNRIVKLLAQSNTGLRVGVFTSQTDESMGQNYVLSKWQKVIVEDLMNNNNMTEIEASRRIRNVWCESRDQLRQNPPDILITNYSMLEYMLLRYKDQGIFIPGGENPLQTIVLDEAHFYSGTLGDDLHMLLRRTLLRMGINLEDNPVRFIATSATIGNEAELKNAAKALFYGKDEVEDADIEVIVGEKEARPFVGDEGQFSEIQRNLRTRLQNASVPVAITSEELEAWKNLDEHSRSYIPAKLHVFFKLPEIYYSDLNVTREFPLGDLSVSPLRGNCNAIPCYYASGARRTVYFSAQCLFSINPASRILVASLKSPLDKAEEMNMVFFRLAFPGDKSSLRFNVIRENDCWRISMCQDGHFAWAIKNDNNDFVLTDECFNGAQWITPEGKSIAIRERWDADEDDLPDNNDKRYLFPLGHISRNMMSTVLAENMMEFLPDAERDNIEELPWRGRQALLFADSRGGAAWNAVSIQNWRQRDYVRNTIYFILENGPKSIADITMDMCEYSSQLALPQRIKGHIQGRENEIHDTFIPALVVGELAIPLGGSGRTLESMRLISPIYDHLPACPERFRPIPTVRDKWQTEILPQIFDVLRRMGKIYHERIQDVIEHCNVDRRDRQHYWDKMVPFRLAQAGAGRIYKSIREGFDPQNNQRQYGCSRDDFRGHNDNHAIRRIIKRYWGIVDRQEIDSIANQIFDLLYGTQEIPYLKRESIGRARKQLLSIDIANLCFRRNEGIFIAQNETHEIKVIPVGAEIPESWHDVNESFTESDDYRIFTGDEIGNIVTAEHSAQLDNKDLEDVETNFKANRINLISCTPTMEIGIDIGSLNAVMQGNLPPERANYVQRVGRAGRRGKNTALALTIMTDSMFDTYISQDTSRIYSRKLTFAKTDLKRDSQEIKRHVHMFFISEYFKELAIRGVANNSGNNPIGAWESVGHFFADIHIIEKYIECLQQVSPCFGEERAIQFGRDINALNDLLNNAQTSNVSIPLFSNLANQITAAELEPKYMELIAHTACENDFSFQEALDETQGILENLKDECNDNWDRLISSLSDQLANGPQNDTNRRIINSLVIQLEKSFQQHLVEYLGQKRIIPAYGFPLDVISLYTDDGTVERELKSAIREFAPGNTLIKSMDAYTVKGLMPNFMNPENGAFDMLYFAQCPACQQINVGAVSPSRCRSCGAEILQDSVRSAIKPNGFSTYPGRDASAFLTRPSLWTKSDVILNLEPVTFRRGSAATAFQFTSLKHDKSIIYRNLGEHGVGYWLCSCNAMGSEYRYNDPTDDAYKKHLDNAPSGNHEIKKHNISIACQGLADVWLCRMPSVIFNNHVLTPKQIEITGEILSIALQVVAARRLNADSRVFESQYYYKQNEGLTLCVYEAGASSGYLKALKNDEANFVREALELITACNCQRGCGKCILNYSSSRKLGLISSDDYQAVKNWLKDHQNQLLAHEDQLISGQAVCGADLFELMESIKKAATIHLVLPSFDRSMLDNGKNLINWLANRNSTTTNIYIKDYNNQGRYIERLEAYFTEQGILSLLNRSNQRVRFFIVDNDWFDAGLGKNLFLQVDDKTYMLEDTVDRNIIIDSMENDHWNDVCKIINDAFRPAYPDQRGPICETRLEFPVPRHNFKFNGGESFDFTHTILDSLDIQGDCQRIEYSDCYIINPLHWALLMQLFRSLNVSNECSLDIQTLCPNESKQQEVSINTKEAMKSLCPSWWSSLKNNCTLDKELALFPAQDGFIKSIYAEYLPIREDRITIRRVKRGGFDRLDHYRYLKMTFANGHSKTLYFDSGIDAFTFARFPTSTHKYFDDNRDRLVVKKNTLISYVEDDA